MTRASLIPWAKPDFWGDEQTYLTEALSSTWISGGPFVERFEREFAGTHEIPFAVSAANGTAAIHMAYLALRIGAGDEIVVPGFGFLAAAHMAVHMGATPVFAEVDPRTWCLTAADVEARLSSRTKAVVAVHTYGNMCDVDGIRAMVANSDIAVIEDAAEALFSRYGGRLAGTGGTLGTFSFQATKTITTGEGGMVVTRDADLHDRLALYRSHGMRRQRYYWHELPGHNFRLTNLQAAMGCAQLRHVETILGERRRVHKQYLAHLAEAPGIVPQWFPPEVDPVLWAMAVKLEPRVYRQGRDVVMEQMRRQQIETRNGFFAPSLMPTYACPALPICEDLSQHVLSLPTFATLSDEDIVYVCDTLKSLRS
jgi:perosamine synthetase